jgi:hypothetical protein
MAKRKRIPAFVQKQIDNGFEDNWRSRHPGRWFCSGYCPRGLPRCYGLGSTKEEALANAQLGAVQRDHRFIGIHTDVGLAKWTFVTFPPWRDNDESEEAPEPVLSGTGADR